MKLSKEELKKKVAEIIGDDETAVTLLEDIEDSMDVTEETDNTAYEELKGKYDELLSKYKERFISGAVEEKEDDIEELEEEEVIDVQEI